MPIEHHTASRAAIAPATGEPRQTPYHPVAPRGSTTPAEQMGRLLRPRGGRVLLHAPAEPHERRRGRQDRPARGRRGRHAHDARARLRTSLRCSTSPRPASHVVASSAIYGGTYNLLARHHGARWASRARSSRPTAPTRSSRRHSARTRKAVFGETIANPALAVLDIERFAAGRARARRAAHRGQHVPHAGELPSHRVGRRHRDALHHQVHGRPRCGAWAAPSLTRASSTGWRTLTTSPASTTPDESLPRRDLCREVRPGGRLHHQGDRAADARLWLHPEPAERLHPEPWPGEPARAHAAGTARTAWPWPSSCRTATRSRACASRACRADPYHELAREVPAERLVRRGVASSSRAGARRPSASWRALKLAAIETHVADARTCCLHPASSTHRQMTDDELLAAGISPAMVRMSCGLEGTDDLVADIAQALEQA